MQIAKSLFLAREVYAAGEALFAENWPEPRPERKHVCAFTTDSGKQESTPESARRYQE